MYHGKRRMAFIPQHTYTSQELREIREHDSAIRLHNSKRPHAVCHAHGASKRDGSPKAFIEDDRGDVCWEAQRMDGAVYGKEPCRAFWQSVPCPMDDGCLHG